MVNTFHFISNHNTTSHLPKDSVRWTKEGRLGISELKGESSGEFPGMFLSPVWTCGYLCGYTHNSHKGSQGQERVGQHDRNLLTIMPALREAALLCPPNFTEEAGFIDGRLCSKPFPSSKVAPVEHMGQDISTQHCWHLRLGIHCFGRCPMHHRMFSSIPLQTLINSTTIGITIH